MKLIVQRVEKAEVIRISDNETLGKIDQGLFVLVGFKRGDTKKDVNCLAEKLTKLRIMKDGEKKMNLSVKDVGGSLLIVSQFTLYADTKDGNRPSFIYAEDPVKAKELYELFVNKLREYRVKVETGIFGDYMQIKAIMDGPVTIIY